MNYKGNTLEILPRLRNRTLPSTSEAPPVSHPSCNISFPPNVAVILAFTVVASLHFKIVYHPGVHPDSKVFPIKKIVISFKFPWIHRLFLFPFLIFTVCLLKNWGHFPDWILLLSYSWCSSSWSSDLNISYKLSAGSRGSIRLRFHPFHNTINRFEFLYWRVPLLLWGYKMVIFKPIISFLLLAVKLL